ncbi:histidinol dehydrogenase [Caldilinea sp.]|uniref:histidinol dehydrogenase n=1 Tax=Caldilinea sp. TaxID=2293560 RepID=UPI0021DDFA04|nr:histidinol dehydrogenase [Caldilinea sp.]GIV68001.1 MAG: histidinol dehydrogenase [Caldilinea sp.]
MQIFDVESARRTILRRTAWDEVSVPPAVLERIEQLFGERIGPEEAVRRILADVRARGATAVLEWSQRLDGAAPAALQVPPEAIRAAYDAVAPEVVEALRLAAARVEAFHRRQPTPSWIHNDAEGTLGQLVRPIERVGVYIPGGTAPLPSSLMMTVVPARVAGVPFVAAISPPQRATGLPHPAILVAADIAGVDAVYTAGGAQAIGALAFGADPIARVDKIFGPGSLFTTLAKRQVFGIVGIDGLPGPTETLVIADESADPQLAAADLLAQAEHDVLASAILLTPSRALAEAVQAAVHAQMETLERSEIIAGSLARNSGIVVTESLAQAFELANAYAPEHLCLLVRDPWQYLGQVRNAGGVFLGERSFEVLGDYVAGPSHVMPTGGTARYASPVNVLDFVKIVSVVGLNEQALQAIGPAAQTLACAEGLTAHAAAVQRRLSER